MAKTKSFEDDTFTDATAERVFEIFNPGASKPKAEPITEKKEPPKNEQNNEPEAEQGSADNDTPLTAKKPTEGIKTAKKEPWICRKCGTENNGEAKTCSHCGIKKTVKANNKPHRAKRNNEEPNNKRFQLMIPDSMFAQIDAISSVRTVSVNSVMKEALADYIEAHSEELELWEKIKKIRGDLK